MLNSFYPVGNIFIWLFTALIHRRNPFPCIFRFQIVHRMFQFGYCIFSEETGERFGEWREKSCVLLKYLPLVTYILGPHTVVVLLTAAPWTPVFLVGSMAILYFFRCLLKVIAMTFLILRKVF